MSENEPTGYFFLLPGGSSVRALPIGEVGGMIREATAEQAAAYPQLVETVRLLIGLCDYGDFSNGIVGPNGVDQDSVQTRSNFIEPARQLLYSLGEVVGDEPEDVQRELGAYPDPFSDDPPKPTIHAPCPGAKAECAPSIFTRPPDADERLRNLPFGGATP